MTGCSVHCVGKHNLRCISILNKFLNSFNITTAIKESLFVIRDHALVLFMNERKGTELDWICSKVCQDTYCADVLAFNFGNSDIELRLGQFVNVIFSIALPPRRGACHLFIPGPLDHTRLHSRTLCLWLNVFEKVIPFFIYWLSCNFKHGPKILWENVWYNMRGSTAWLRTQGS